MISLKDFKDHRIIIPIYYIDLKDHILSNLNSSIVRPLLIAMPLIIILFYY